MTKHYIPEMTVIDYMYQEKKAEEDLPALKIAVFNWNHFEMRLLNLRINLFYLFLFIADFFPHLGSFCVVSFSLRFVQISPLAFFGEEC